MLTTLRATADLMAIASIVLLVALVCP